MKTRRYIIPTRHGLMFIGGLVVMLLTAASYNNNLVYLLSFMLFGILMVSMVVSNANLQGLRVDFVSAKDQAEGQDIEVKLRLTNLARVERRGLRLRLRGEAAVSDTAHETTRLKPEMSVDCVVQMAGRERGVHSLPVVILESVFPVGLFYTWSPLRLDQEILVYPKPEGHLTAPILADDERQGASQALSSAEQTEFHEHKKFLPGDSHRLIDWKAYARSRRLMTKCYAGEAYPRYLLRAEPLLRNDPEKGLRQLARWLIDAEREGAEFALVWSSESRPSFHAGRAHLKKCLRELAEYPREGRRVG